ncbi:DinB family protein [Pelobium sp.]|nr:DinB family protein [Pelobium sp.]MDA9554686.1 DinB family protein [Pelobium sp.]
MSVKSNKEALKKSLRFYEEFLKTINEELFLTTPPIGGWSYSEVYSHILSVNFMSAIAVEKCLNKTAELKTQKPHWISRLILFLGQFPPGKIKAPAQVEASVKKISKEEAANQLVKFYKKLAELFPENQPINLNYKIKHPRLGYLDAASWLRFMVVHTRHHQKQIKNISNSFAA